MGAVAQPGPVPPSRRSLVPLLLVLLLAGCVAAPRARRGATERGIASWYGPGFHGRHTANGEIYDMHALTAAHQSLPFGTVVEVRNLDNGRRVRVRINDRGPFVRGRIIDLSKAGARAIGMLGAGTARVELRVVRLAGPVPASTGKAAAEWLVQAGAFYERVRADERARDLERYGPVRVVSAGGLHRVLLGPWSEEPAARKVARRLRAVGVEAFVRRR